MKKQTESYENQQADIQGSVNSGSVVPHRSLTPIVTEKRSETIPLPSTHVQRTRSETQLCEDMAVAERRDETMFYRLINGIRHRQMNLAPHHTEPNYCHPMSSLESDRSIASIINTRNTPIDKTICPLETIRSMQGAPDEINPPRINSALHPMVSAITNQNQYYASTDSANCVDDWSVSGFEQGQCTGNIGRTNLHETGQLYKEHLPPARQNDHTQGAMFGLHPNTNYATGTEEEEEMFTLDL